MWEAVTGTLITTLDVKGHENEVTSVSRKPWSRRTTPDVISVCFSPDGSKIATVADVKTVPVCDAATGVLVIALQGHTDQVTSLCFSLDGSKIASTSDDKTVRAKGALVTTLEGHTGGAMSVCFSPDGSKIASGSLDKTVRVWDAATGASINTLVGQIG